MSPLQWIRNWKIAALLVLLVANVWLGAWLLSKSWVTGLLVAGLLVVGFGLLLVIEILVGRRRASKLRSSIVAQSRIPGGESPDALVQNFQGGLNRLGGELGKDFLYTHPWFLLLGEPSSGKSTSIRESRIPLALTNKQQGIGGTLNCDWWFTQDAVILDIAGRLAVNERLQDVWDRFLELLKKSRPRRPIDGVIVTIPADKLIAGKRDRRQAIADAEKMAEQLSTRLAELQKKLEVVFPVHVLVTKCDKIRGFEETFALLSDPQKSTLFGWSNDVPASSEPKANWIDECFESTRRDIARVRDQVLAPGSVRASSNVIYLFEEEFLALRPVLEVYLKKLFAKSLTGDQQLLRGVFFSSGGQDKKPGSSLFGVQPEDAEEVAGAAASPEPESTGRDATFELESGGVRDRKLWGRPYFVHDFYATKVFGEDGLVKPTAKARDTRNQYIRYAKVAAIVLGCLGVGYLGYAFVGAHGALANLSESVEQVGETARLNNPLDTTDGSLVAAYERLEVEGANLPLIATPGSLADEVGTRLDRVLSKGFARSVDAWPDFSALQNATGFKQFAEELERLHESYARLSGVHGRKKPVREVASALREIVPEREKAIRETLDKLSGDATWFGRDMQVEFDLDGLTRRFRNTVPPLYSARVATLRALTPGGFPGYRGLQTKASAVHELYEKLATVRNPPLSDTLGLADAVAALDTEIAARNTAFDEAQTAKKSGTSGLVEGIKEKATSLLTNGTPETPLTQLLAQDLGLLALDESLDVVAAVHGKSGDDWGWTLDDDHARLASLATEALLANARSELKALGVTEGTESRGAGETAETLSVLVVERPKGSLERLRGLATVVARLAPVPGRENDPDIKERYARFVDRLTAVRKSPTSLAQARQLILEDSRPEGLAEALESSSVSLRKVIEREFAVWNESTPMTPARDGGLRPNPSDRLEPLAYLASLEVLARPLARGGTVSRPQSSPRREACDLRGVDETPRYAGRRGER